MHSILSCYALSSLFFDLLGSHATLDVPELIKNGPKSAAYVISARSLVTDYPD
jgi:hypothetical protein